MSESLLRAEVLVSTLVLTPRQACVAAPIDVRPALLAAQLNADRHCAGCADPHLWWREYSRVMRLSGWHQRFHEQGHSVPHGLADVAIHEQLAQGLGALCSARLASAVAQVLASVAAAPAHSPALQLLGRHAWQGASLNLQVALLEPSGELIAYGIHYLADSLPAGRWLAQPVRLAAGSAPLCTRASVSRVDARRYGPLLEHLKARLGDRLHTVTASFADCP